MKRIILLIIFYIIIFRIDTPSQCGGGELYFKVKNAHINCNYIIDVSITTSEYCWYWDPRSEKPVYSDNFQSSREGIVCEAYLAPKRGTDYDVVIPWGIFQITIRGRNSDGQIIIERNFTLDLRDENWSHYGEVYPGVDTFIEFDPEGVPKITISARQFEVNNTYIVSNGSVFKIWELWEVSTPPLQSNFTAPVVLKNRIENELFDFGYIKSGSFKINSGDEALLQPIIMNSIEHGTIDTLIDSEKKFSFKWIANSNITLRENQNYFYSILDFSFTPIPQ